MDVLYMSARPPYPPHKGDQLIAWEQLKQLKRTGCQVHLISFVRSKQEGELIKNKLSPYCKEVTLFPVHPLQKLFRPLKTLYNFRPMQVNLFLDPKVKKYVMNMVANLKPDMIHVQTARVAEYFIDNHNPKCMDMIDVLSQNMERRAQTENKWLKPIFLLESHLMKRYEKEIIKKFDRTLIVSESEKKYLSSRSVVVNPNGTFITKNHLADYPSSRKEKIILFHGNMQYYPNVEAVVDFVEEAWPHIHKAYPDYQFYIVGKDPVKKVTALHGKDNVVVTGFVEDICIHLRQAQIGIYPLKSGTGMQNKILESMACGLPTIASPRALQGIAGWRENELICTPNVEEMIAAVKNLLENPELQKRYAAKGQAFVQKNYSWEHNCKKLIDTWQDAVMHRSSETEEKPGAMLIH